MIESTAIDYSYRSSDKRHIITMATWKLELFGDIFTNGTPPYKQFKLCKNDDGTYTWENLLL